MSHECMDSTPSCIMSSYIMSSNSDVEENTSFEHDSNPVSFVRLGIRRHMETKPPKEEQELSQIEYPIEKVIPSIPKETIMEIQEKVTKGTLTEPFLPFVWMEEKPILKTISKEYPNLDFILHFCTSYLLFNRYPDVITERTYIFHDGRYTIENVEFPQEIKIYLGEEPIYRVSIREESDEMEEHTGLTENSSQTSDVESEAYDFEDPCEEPYED